MMFLLLVLDVRVGLDFSVFCFFRLFFFSLRKHPSETRSLSPLVRPLFFVIVCLGLKSLFVVAAVDLGKESALETETSLESVDCGILVSTCDWKSPSIDDPSSLPRLQRASTATRRPTSH